MVKKVYYGAQEQPLTELAQLCVDTASYRKIAAERPGVRSFAGRRSQTCWNIRFTR